MIIGNYQNLMLLDDYQFSIRSNSESKDVSYPRYLLPIWPVQFLVNNKLKIYLTPRNLSL